MRDYHYINECGVKTMTVHTEYKHTHMEYKMFVRSYSNKDT